MDNLASLLGTTSSCVGHIGYGIIGGNAGFAAGGYGLKIAQEQMSTSCQLLSFLKKSSRPHFASYLRALILF